MTYVHVDHEKLAKPSIVGPPKSEHDYEALIRRCTLNIRLAVLAAILFFFGTLITAACTIAYSAKQDPPAATFIIMILCVFSGIASILLATEAEGRLPEKRAAHLSALHHWHRSVPQGLVTKMRHTSRGVSVTLYGYTRNRVLTSETHHVDLPSDTRIAEGDYIDIRHYPRVLD